MLNIAKALTQKKLKVGNTIFIAVDGHGGSGKSSLAEWLATKLHAEVIHTDDFASWDNPMNWWPQFIERIFTPIANGSKVLNYPRSKWWEHQERESIIDQPVTKIMIVEGVSSLRKEFRDYISLGIFVDTSKDICLQRGIERDTGAGKSKEDLLKIWNTWFEEEEIYMKRDNPRDYADIVINGTRPFDEQLEV